MAEIAIRGGVETERNVHVTGVHLDMVLGRGRVLEYRRDAVASWAVPIAGVEQRADGCYWTRGGEPDRGPFPTPDAAAEAAYLFVERRLEVRP